MRGPRFFFEIADQEGPLSVITGLITEIRHLTLLTYLEIYSGLGMSQNGI
jgi:hypothetical protein